jgi:hypothetical protein
MIAREKHLLQHAVASFPLSLLPKTYLEKNLVGSFGLLAPPKIIKVFNAFVGPNLRSAVLHPYEKQDTYLLQKVISEDLQG